jgi:hypothetical protein
MHRICGPGLLLFVLLSSGCEGEERTVTTFSDTLDADGLDRLIVTVVTGDLEVVGEADRDEVAVSVALVTTRTSEAKDEDAMSATRLELIRRDDGAAILTVRLDPSVGRYETLVTVTVPEDFGVEAARSSSEDDQLTLIQDVASVGVVDGDGELFIEDIAGGGTVDDAAGDMLVSGLGDDLSVIDGDGDTTIRDIDGDVVIDDGDGDLFISDVTGAVTINDGAGDIVVENVGSLNVESDSGGSVSVQ